jgi:transcriptional regulator with XRE-family HTH domain
VKTHKEVMDNLTPVRREQVKARAEELRTEIRLEEIRKSRKVTQVELARNMRVSQPAVSQMEKDSRISIIRLKRFTEALGGKLNIQVEFPDGKNYKVL